MGDLLKQVDRCGFDQTLVHGGDLIDEEAGNSLLVLPLGWQDFQVVRDLVRHRDPSVLSRDGQALHAVLDLALFELELPGCSLLCPGERVSELRRRRLHHSDQLESELFRQRWRLNARTVFTVSLSNL